MNFIIYAPWPFTLTSGGILALHKLADSLSNISGENLVGIFTEQKNEPYKGHHIKSELEAKAFVSIYNPIVIYPEIVASNPLQANKVIRWILNTPGICAGVESTEDTWQPTDFYFKYDTLYIVKHEERVKGRLFVMESFADIFYDKGLKRNGKMCHLFRKGAYKVHNWHSPDSLCIEDLNGNFTAMSDIFNEYSVFVCYDDHCFTSTLAAMCGILVIIVPGEDEPEKWYEEFLVHKYGQSYGLRDIQRAIDTKHLVKDLVNNKVRFANSTIIAFVETCKELFETVSL